MKLEKYTHLAFFYGLSATEIQLLAPFFVPQAWVAGTVIFEQGDRAVYFYLMVSGELTIRYKPDDGPMMTVTRIQPGGIFGWSAAIGNPIYTSGAVCTLDSEVLCIRGSDLRMLCDKHPDLGKVILDRLSAIIAERQRSQQSRVNSMLTNGMRQQTNS
jgi:CRP/FNR family cyclic AMP-dependent transcriptional regulator